jgi:hypothetical protein
MKAYVCAFGDLKHAHGYVRSRKNPNPQNKTMMHHLFTRTQDIGSATQSGAQLPLTDRKSVVPVNDFPTPRLTHSAMTSASAIVMWQAHQLIKMGTYMHIFPYPRYRARDSVWGSTTGEKKWKKGSRRRINHPVYLLCNDASFGESHLTSTSK